MVSADDFAQWRDDPITKAVMRLIVYRGEDLREDFVNRYFNTYALRKRDDMHMVHFNRGIAEGYRRVLAIDAHDLIEGLEGQ